MNCVMGLKSLLHLRDGYRFLPHRGVAWETHKRADPPAECCETQRDEPEGLALWEGNSPSSPFAAIFPEYGLLILQT